MDIRDKTGAFALMYHPFSSIKVLELTFPYDETCTSRKVYST